MSFLGRCASIPPSGGGGCHPALLSAANAGVREDLTDDEIVSGIRAHLDDSIRPISDKEIADTIRTARADGGTVPQGNRQSFLTPPAIHGAQLRGALVSASAPTNGMELIHLSRVILPADPTEQTKIFFRHMYQPGDLLYVGPEMSASAEYIVDAGVLACLGTPTPKFILNPVTGDPAPTKDGLGQSVRCDGAVAGFRYLLMEMDGVPVEDQVRLWTTIVREDLLPVASVCQSGGKSVHALIRVPDVRTIEEWYRVVRDSFYPQFGVPLGVDANCRNPSRFCRVPGAQEEGRGTQWLLYLG